MPMSKIKDIKLETTATYQPLSDLNVRFWSQDKNTAELRFIITRNQFPLSLSKENVKVIIALESGSSFISSDDFIIDSEVEGVARYIIPTDFMRVASNVTGQVYVTTLDKEEIIVERQFKFTVSNDLLSDYPSEDKLRYIKTFDDLRNEIASRVSKLESDMETMEDYVVQVQDTTQEGITALTNLIKQKQDAYNANHTAKMKELNDKGTEYTTKFDDDKVYMDDKFQAFQESVNGSGLVTTGQSKDWQKVKLTSDSGIRTYLTKGSVKDIKALSSGFYETVVAGTTDATEFPKVSYGSFVEIDVMKADGGRTQLKLVINSTGRTFNRYIHTDASNDTGWLEVPQFADITTMETTSGSQAKATTAENNAKQYTDNKVLNDKTLIYNGSANGVGTDLNLSETLDNFVFLFIYGSASGVYFTATGNPMDNNNITVSCTNVIDSEGNGGGHYEALLSKTSRTKLKITNDVYFDFGSGIGSGANANKITINKIIGVRKYANIN